MSLLAALDLGSFRYWFRPSEIAELLLMAAVVFAAARLPGRVRLAMARPLGWAGRAGRRPGVVCVFVCVASFTGAALHGLLVHAAEPSIHDEFSYLLGADTFASGRLTNPAHPYWEHFEAPHVIQQPTCQSKYPPGQAVALAAGQVAAGDPLAGVWLSTALACAAAAWCLFGWLPPRWAVVGAVILVLRVGIAGRWAQSYWGGSVAFLGGALVWGALPRLWRAPSIVSGLAFGAGAGILACTRPFEGLLATAIPAAALLWRVAMRPAPHARRPWLLGGVLPAAAPLLFAVAAHGLYNRAVTGHATTMPYFVHQQRYARISPFLWGQPPDSPESRHLAMRQYFDEEERATFEAQRSAPAARLLRVTLFKIIRATEQPFAAWAPALLLALPILWKLRRARILLAGAGVFLAGVACETVVHPHYLAPMTAAGFVAVGMVVRSIAARRRAAAAGLVLVSVAYLGWMELIGAGALPERWGVPGMEDAFGRTRAHFQVRLEEIEGDDLVFVRYGEHHSCHLEWVYNRADIDRAAVIWARDLGAENAGLLAYYPGRRAWLLEVDWDHEMPRLSPYPGR